MSDQVFVLRDGWHVVYNGVVAKATWEDKGAAEAQLNLLRSGYSTMLMSGSIVHREAMRAEGSIEHLS